jgi:hypothetical protein
MRIVLFNRLFNIYLLFHYCLLSPCIVTCKIYLVSSIVILFIVIVSNICNEQNITILVMHICAYLFVVSFIPFF